MNFRNKKFNFVQENKKGNPNKALGYCAANIERSTDFGTFLQPSSSNDYNKIE